MLVHRPSSSVARLIIHADISATNMTSLVINLWTLSNKHGHVGSKFKVYVMIIVIISTC